MGATELRAAAATMPRAWFAVTDGAHFDDLPALLDRAGLRGHPLYLEAGDPAGVRAGPYLLSLADQREIAVLIELAADKPALAFWSWPGPLETLRRHLRGLNLCEIPNENRAGPDDPEYETVLFRHWDPNVLAVTLPVLTPEQQSRFLGDSAGVVFDATEHGGVIIAPRPDPLPPQPVGMLRFEPEQVAGMTSGRILASHRRIASYVREAAPEQTARTDDRVLLDAIGRYDHEARELGLAKESDIARWSFLQVISGGDLFTDVHVREVFNADDTPLGPTERMDALMEAVGDGLGAGA